jgi:hypothetical protein
MRPVVRGRTNPLFPFVAVQPRRCRCSPQKKIRRYAVPPSLALIHMQAAEYGSLYNHPTGRLCRCSLAGACSDIGSTYHAASPGYSALPNPESSFADCVRLRESTSRDTPAEGSRPVAHIQSSPAALALASAELVRSPGLHAKRTCAPE